MIWMLLSTALANPSCSGFDNLLTEGPAFRCGTPNLHVARTRCPDVLERHGFSVTTPRPPTNVVRPPGTTKITRDSLGTWTNVVETTNFAIKWGDDTNVQVSQIQRIADSFEAVWTEEVDGWGYEGPEFSDTYRFNVYIGDTGSPSPTADGYGGYFWWDADGYPEIVLERAALSDVDWADDLAAHEFFHALQAVIGTYPYEGASAWYSESTATWAETEVRGTKPSNSTNTPSVFLLPELNVGYFGDIDNDLWADYHQYGAVVFIRHLTTVTEDPDIVRRSWVEAPVNGDPLLVLDDLLTEDGFSIRDVHRDYAARFANWDFPEGEVYLGQFNQWTTDPENHRIQGAVFFDGTTQVLTPVHPPQSYGANLWELSAGTEMRITFTPLSIPDDWDLVIAALDDGVPVQIPVPADGTPYDTEGLVGLTDRHLVVSARGPTGDYSTTFAYSISLEAIPEEVEEAKACGCASTSSSLIWFLLPLVAVRRRISS